MRILPILIFCAACSITSSTDSTQGVESTAETVSLSRLVTDAEPINIDRAYFYSQQPNSPGARDPLALDSFRVSMTTAPGTLRTRIDAVIRNPSRLQKQARVRVPIPSNAAVTEAVLFVGDKPMRGAFLGAKRAEQVYKSYTQRRRDPLLAVWGGPNWVDLQIFPVEGEQTRRFQLEWVEPHVAGSELHRLPLLANAGNVLTSLDEVLVNGQPVAAKDGKIALKAPLVAAVSVRPPGAALGYVLAAGERPTDSALVLVAETSAHMSLDHRAKQRRDIQSVLERLPASTRVTLLSADWLTKKIAVDKSPELAIAALTELDDIISAGSLDIKNTITEASALAKKADSNSIVFFGRGESAFGADAYETSTQALLEQGASLFVIAPDVASPDIQALARRTAGRTVSADEPQLVNLLRSRGEAPEVPGVQGWTVLDSANGEPMWMGYFLGEKPESSMVGSVADLAALWARSQVYAHGANKFLRGGQVLTPATSILVLENDSEYRRWGIPVPAAVKHSQQAQKMMAHNPAKRAKADRKQGGTWDFFRGWSSRPDSSPVKRQAMETAQRSGTLGVTKRFAGVGVASSEDFSSGIDDRDVYGGLMGTELSEMSGGWGYGVAGIGPGGGGTGWGTIGTGNYGSIGHGAGSGKRGRRGKVQQLALGNATVAGGLDKNIIRRYVRRKMPRIRHCFEKELLVKPALNGTILVSFQITPTGLVQGTRARGISNRNVESCVAGAIRSIRFPNPSGGGFVNVRYPFTFGFASASPPVLSPLAKALAAFDKGERAKKLSQELGVDFASEAMLAWWILNEKLQRLNSPLEGVVLAAVLLHDAGDDWNSRRVFSQIGAGASKETIKRLRSMGFEADANRMAGL